MILIDTNIIITFWRTPNEEIKEILQNNRVFLCGVVEAELLHGARNENQIIAIKKALINFERIEIEDNLWFEAGLLLNKLKNNGLSVPFQDVILCALALRYDLALWSNDKHFKLMQPILTDLKLL